MNRARSIALFSVLVVGLLASSPCRGDGSCTLVSCGGTFDIDVDVDNPVPGTTHFTVTPHGGGKITHGSAPNAGNGDVDIPNGSANIRLHLSNASNWGGVGSWLDFEAWQTNC